MSTSNPIKPIRTIADYRRARARLEDILYRSEGERDYDRFDVLSVLVHDYEEQHHPIDPPDPVDAILFRLEQQGLPTSALERFIGTRHRVSEILNRRRPLSITMINALHEGLGIPAEILIRRAARSPLKRSRSTRKAIPRNTSPHRRVAEGP
jgi:HTH-type transcriptional regulator/antitoxin HigA